MYFFYKASSCFVGKASAGDPRPARGRFLKAMHHARAAFADLRKRQPITG